MNINGINAGMQASQNGKALGHAKKSESPTPAISPTSKPDTQVGASTDGAKVKGVVRLLQEGHFKGVADVRLRINFHDELTQLSIQSVQVDFSAQFSDFIQSAQDSFDTFMATTEATEEQAASATNLFDAFITSANTLADTFLADGGSDFSGVAAELETAFDALVSELETLFPPAPTPVVLNDNEIQELEGLEGVDTPPNDPQPALTPLGEFRAALTEHLERLLESMQESATNLPELSEPNGNGVAFDKFMEMLEALNTGDGAENTINTGMEDIIA